MAKEKTFKANIKAKGQGTSTELYAKIQLVIDELDKRFFSGAKKEKIPQLVFAINNKCRSCVVAYVQADALYDKKTDTKLQYMGINPDVIRLSMFVEVVA